MTSTMSTRPGSRTTTRWRTVDIVVGAVLAVAFGVVFQAWNLLWSTVDPAFTAFPPAAGVLVGLWLAAGVVGGLVIRKPGAAFFVEAVAALVSAMLGSQWGVTTIVYGLLQGLAIELAFALARYRSWGIVTAALAGAAGGAMAAVLDLVYYYAEWSAGWKVAYVAVVAASGLVLAGLLGWALVRALARTGVLAPFPAGRTTERV
jgi:energy-coupling factor transport system substrate-specific component